jgi:glycerophosphoryl diester phosphodiesterase
VTPRFVEIAHRAGLAVNVWTIDDRATATALLAAGVDGLIVDRWDVLGSEHN